MGIKKTLGGDRLGSEKKMTVDLPEYGRSTHNVSKITRTDQAAGTLVPYWCQIGTDGTTFDVDITTKVKTLPTVGPIFGSFKHQIDLFCIPIRLYIAALHNNALGIGLKMSQVKLPRIRITANTVDWKEEDLNSQQVNPSALLSYIGIRGFGNPDTGFIREFPAIFLLAYWDIYKNYYANKQEEIGVVIDSSNKEWTQVQYTNGAVNIIETNNEWTSQIETAPNATITFTYPTAISFEEAQKQKLYTGLTGTNPAWVYMADEKYFKPTNTDKTIPKKEWTWTFLTAPTQGGIVFDNGSAITPFNNKSIALKTFPLANIDNMRNAILQAPQTAPFIISGGYSGTEQDPYQQAIKYTQIGTPSGTSKLGTNSWYDQAGLGIKTYLSDRFNNWLSTEWIDGTTSGINEITSVDVSDGKLSMDALILAKKIFDVLNRIAISGGSYNDWREAAYGVRTVRLPESPIYVGGMQSEIVFDEVVSNSAAEQEPLGTLAGKGVDKMHKSGRSIHIKCEEPSMIMAIGSITPRVDYSQGNKWWNRLETMDDLHKPGLDAIGFQELLTEEFAAFDTEVYNTNAVRYKSIGKQPSWIEYMTDVNETYGSFAAFQELSFMCLNRIYHQDQAQEGALKDGTTYIDPIMFNVAFADASLSGKNFWVQVGFDAYARRVMSAKQIPNL